jgi:phenylacetaldehyde dehydrogenase
MYMAGWATKIEGASVMNMSPVYLPGSRYHAFTRREPIGVCGQITPWNFPLQMAAWKIAPALAAGCTVILKPAEQTPLTAARLVELCQEAGIPDGVVNLVHGLGEEAGAAMAAHRGIDKIAFTGSTQVGKLLAKASGDSNLKRLTLELGGKSPQVVLADADVPAAIAGTATAVFYNHGQMCTSGSRIFIHRRIYSDVLDGILDHARGLKIGPGLELDSTMGPLVSKEQYERVTGYIRSGLSEGATAATGGLPNAALGGFFVEPTVLVDTTAEMTVQREEIFGPVALPIPFDDEDEIVAMANDTTFGLAAGIWSKDVAKALRVAERIQAGKVWINCYNVFDSSLPFGGYKESGWGRECSKEALGNYLETKSVVVAL